MQKNFSKNYFQQIFQAFLGKILLSKHESGFRQANSCFYRLIAITYFKVFGIFSSSDCYPTLEIAGVFVDITKAFDRVWHDRLLFKVKQNDVTGNLFRLITNFFSGRF